jgi:hypothetical protein
LDWRPNLDIEVGRQIGMDYDRETKASFVDDSLDDMSNRLESGPLGLYQKDTLRFRRRDQVAGFFRVCRRRFLHEERAYPALIASAAFE